MFSLILTCQESYRISGRRIDKNYNFYNEILHHLRRYVKSMHPKTCYLVIEYILPYKTFGCCIIYRGWFIFCIHYINFYFYYSMSIQKSMYIIKLMNERKYKSNVSILWEIFRRYRLVLGFIMTCSKVSKIEL